VELNLRSAVAERDDLITQARAEMKDLRSQRQNLIDGVPESLLSLYDKLRGRYHGVGAAGLKVRRCTGCDIEATTADYNIYQAAAADEVLRCAECDRILVRESV
jgi:predicted  nucleic acid-binding Zn-ribbon protein